MAEEDLDDFEMTVPFQQGGVEYYLEIAIPNEPKREVPLSKDSYQIGRAADNDVVIDEPTVSRRHALIHKRAGSFWVQDLSTNNGVSVHGQPVSDHRLRVGDRVMVGSVSITFNSIKGDEAQRTGTFVPPEGFITQTIYGFEALVDLPKKKRALGGIHTELSSVTDRRGTVLRKVGRGVEVDDISKEKVELRERIEERARVQELLDSKREIQSRHQERVNEIQADIKSVEARFQPRIGSVTKKAEEAAARYWTANSEFEQLEAKLSSTRTRIAQREGDHQQIAKVAEMRGDLATMETRISKTVTIRDSAGREHQEAEKAKGEIEQELDTALRPLRSDLEEPQTELMNVTQKISELTGQELNLANQIGEEVYRLRPDVDGLGGAFRELDGLYNRTVELEREVTTLQGWLAGSKRARSQAIIVGGGLLGALILLILLLYLIFRSDSFDVEFAKERTGRVVPLAVVDVDGGKRYIPMGHGSGFCWSEDGYFITNRHVSKARFEAENMLRRQQIRASVQLYVFFPDEPPYPAEVVWESKSYDLAILYIERDDWEYFDFKKTEDLKEGDPVWACGFPGAADRFDIDIQDRSFREATSPDRSMVADLLKHTMTNGIVSKIANFPDAEGNSPYLQIQTNADISPGNSGGPLIAEDNKVVGINTWIRLDVSGINYAIAMDDILNEIETKIEGHRKSR